MTIEQILARKQPPPEPRVGKSAIDFAVARMLDQSPKQRSEIDRICSIPIQVPYTDDELDAVQQLHVKPAAYERGFRLQRVQAEAIQAFMEVGSVFGPIEVGGGKCVLGSTEIFDRKAGLRKTVAAACEDRHLIVDACDEGTLKFARRNATALRSGWKRCSRVALASGHEVSVSDDHKILTAAGWVEASQLQEGDLVATPRRLRAGAGLDVPWSEIHLLAYLLADGSLSHGSVTFVDDNPKTLADVLRCAEMLDMPASVVPERSNASRINLSRALPFTRRWGIQGVLSKHKRVPAQLYDMSEQQTAEFLGRFWACDGHISRSGKLECTLASRGLARDLQHLLLYLGVFSSLHYKQATCSGKKFDAWRLTISGDDALTFLKRVIVVGQTDRQAEATLVLQATPRNTNTDVVPVTWGDHRALSTACGKSLTWIKNRLKLTSGQFVGRISFQRFCKEVGIKHRWAEGDVRWCKVSSVEPIGIHEVFDLSVDQHHNFVADGIVVHNTLISLRCIALAFEQGVHRAALFVPSQVHTQLVEHDIGWARQRVHLGVTFYPLGGLSPERRRAMCGGRRGCWIFPYSLLSARDASEMLETIRPDLMMFDEAHLLKSRDAARTRRVLTYIKKYHPRVSCLSGTMSSKSIKDYAHLLSACLGDGAPVPHEPAMVQEWANTVDSEQAAEGFYAPRASTGPLRPLINWANKNFPKAPRAYNVQGFRWAFRDRLLTAPGVVSSPADALGTSLYIENLKVLSPTPRLAELQKQLDELWLTPSGDEIEFAMQKWKWATELSAGIYNDLVWPDAGQVAERRRISPDEAENILKRSKDHHKLLQAYHKELRGWFQSRPHKPGLDTPMLVGNSMARYGDRDVGSKLYTAWLTARNAWFAEILERDSVPVRVCDYKIKAAIEWMRKLPQGEGIVWYHHQTCGNWLFEQASAAGLPVVHCPAGKQSNDFLTAAGAAERCRGKFLVCSISAHGTGKNLQFLQDQLYVQIPHNEMIAQQAIGRTHRQGQQADEVTCTTMISNEQDELILAALLNDAIYMYETLNSTRKLLQATWNPMPTIYGTHQLQRAGLQSRVLTAKQELMLAERFGKTAPV